jgi:hypothetical protein
MGRGEITMSATRQSPELPGWLLVLGSGAIAFHFFALLMVVLAARSGPWWTELGPTDMEPPQFAAPISEWISRYYLQPLQMTHNYHFASNRADIPTVYFEAKLKDDKGNVVETLRFPEEKQNFWVRYRQHFLAQNLLDDYPVEPPRGEDIPAPGQKAQEVEIWDSLSEPRSGFSGENREGQTLQLRSVKEYLLPRGPGAPPIYRPSNWSKALAQSYSRYLCRQYQVSAVELIRHRRMPLYPALMFMEEPPPQTYEEQICSYGDYRLEK